MMDDATTPQLADTLRQTRRRLMLDPNPFAIRTIDVVDRDGEGSLLILHLTNDGDDASEIADRLAKKLEQG